MPNIRPVRGVKRYEEHLDFYLFSLVKNTRKARSFSSGRPVKKTSSFPYAKEAKIDSAEEFAKAVASLLKAAAKLKLLAEELGGKWAHTILERRIVHSSPAGFVDAYAEPGAHIGTYTIEVKRLAAAQLNRTSFFVPDAPTTLEHGLNRVQVNMGSSSYVLEWNVAAGDTHQAALTRIRDVWNKAETGIQASLEADDATGRIRLALEARETGADGAFFLRDVRGNTASASGLLVRDRIAADARYRLDRGDWVFSASNTIPLAEKSLLIEAQSLPSAPVTLTVAPDLPAIEASLQELNQHLEKVEQELAVSAEYINPSFARSLNQLKEEYQPEAVAGRLAASFSETLQLLTDHNGLLAALRRFLDGLEAVPAEELLNRNNCRYKRYANYLSSLEWYSQLPAQGLLLNKFL